MNFTISFTPDQLPELRETLDRAMNTWEPQDQPKWLRGLSERVDAALGNPMPVVHTRSQKPSSFEGHGPEAYVPLPDGRTIPVHTRSADACNSPISAVLDVIRRDYVPARQETMLNPWAELAK